MCKDTYRYSAQGCKLRWKMQYKRKHVAKYIIWERQWQQSFGKGYCIIELLPQFLILFHWCWKEKESASSIDVHPDTESIDYPMLSSNHELFHTAICSSNLFWIKEYPTDIFKLGEIHSTRNFHIGKLLRGWKKKTAFVCQKQLSDTQSLANTHIEMQNKRETVWFLCAALDMW